jgi:hypothetical protein
MIDTINLIEQAPDFGFILNIAPRKINGRVQPGGVAGAQIVQNPDGMPLPDQIVCQMRANKTGPTGN